MGDFNHTNDKSSSETGYLNGWDAMACRPTSSATTLSICLRSLYRNSLAPINFLINEIAINPAIPMVHHISLNVCGDILMPAHCVAILFNSISVTVNIGSIISGGYNNFDDITESPAKLLVWHGRYRTNTMA